MLKSKKTKKGLNIKLASVLFLTIIISFYFSVSNVKAEIFCVDDDLKINNYITEGKTKDLIKKDLNLMYWLLFFTPFLGIINIPFFIKSLYQALKKDHSNPWGIIIDSETKEPIKFAVCMIYYENSQAVLKRIVTDEGGKYNTGLEVGNYRLEIKAEGYRKSVAFLNVYEGEKIIYPSFSLIKEDSQKKLKKEKLSGQFVGNIKLIWFYLEKFLATVGLIVLIYSSIISFKIWYLIFYIIYVVPILLWVMEKIVFFTKKNILVDSHSYLKVPFAQIKLYDLKTEKLLETCQTNQKGEFMFWGREGNYGLLIFKQGYLFPSKLILKKQEVVKINDVFMLKVKLKRNSSGIKIYIDKA